MSTAAAVLDNPRIGRSPGHTATIYLKEAKYEYLKNLRLRVYSASVIGFPLMFYVLFGLVLNSKEAIVGGTTMTAYLIATYGTFGVMGASLFGTAAGLAADRGLGWLQVKRASPMPPFAYFIAKVALSMIFSAIVVSLLLVFGISFGGVRLPLAEMAKLLATLVAGSLPSSAMGLAIGYFAGPNSVPSVINLILSATVFLLRIVGAVHVPTQIYAADRARAAALSLVATGARNCRSGAPRAGGDALGGVNCIQLICLGRGPHRLPARPGQIVWLKHMAGMCAREPEDILMNITIQ